MKYPLSASLFGISALLMGTYSAAVSASTVVATWADPNTSSFSFTDDGNNSNGIGSLIAASSGFTLSTPLLNSWIFNNASYVMTDMFGGALDTTSQADVSVSPGIGYVSSVFEAGKIVIKTDQAQHGFNAGDTLLTINFGYAVGVFGNVTSLEFTGNSITFAGPALNGNIVTAEQFSFSVANLSPLNAVLSPADMETWTATTSFTSSATVVPVPAAAWLFGSGLLGLIGIARKKAA